jgi:hypothetical protein
MTISLFMYKNLFYNNSCVARWCLVVFQDLDYGVWSWVQNPSAPTKFNLIQYKFYSNHMLC